jgi:hypothetical protein
VSTKIRLHSVEIAHAEPGNGPTGDKVLVHLEIASDVIGNLPITITISPYKTLDDAVEVARQKLWRFATDLTTEADGPIR